MSVCSCPPWVYFSWFLRVIGIHGSAGTPGPPNYRDKPDNQREAAYYQPDEKGQRPITKLDLMFSRRDLYGSESIVGPEDLHLTAIHVCAPPRIKAVQEHKEAGDPRVHFAQDAL